MKGAGWVIVLMWLVFVVLFVAYALSVDLAATFNEVLP